VGKNGKILWTRWRIFGAHNMQTMFSSSETFSYQLQAISLLALKRKTRKAALCVLFCFLSWHQATAKPQSSTVGTPGTSHTDSPYRNRTQPMPDYRATAGTKRNKYTHARTHFTACFSTRLRLPLLQLIRGTKGRAQISCRTVGNNDGTHKYALRLCACARNA
jgi:hypothetical protein